MPRERGSRWQNSRIGGGDRGRGGGDRGSSRGGRGAGRGNLQSSPSPHPSRSSAWLQPGMQTSHTLDLFNNLTLNDKDESIVFEGGFEDFSLDNSTRKRSFNPQLPSRLTSVPPPAPPIRTSPYRGSPSFRGRGGPWRGRASLVPPPIPLAFSRMPWRGGYSSRGRNIDTGPPIKINPGPPPKISKQPTIASKGSRVLLKALERDRPLLKPVTFVRGEHQTLLFEEEEEILHVPGEDKEHVDRVLPSADTIERIFHPEILDDNEDGEEAEKYDSDAQDEDVDSAQAVEATPGPVVETVIQTVTDRASLSNVFPESEEPVVQRKVIVEESDADAILNLPPYPSEHIPIMPHSPEPPLFIISTDPDATSIEETSPNDNVLYNSLQSHSLLGITSDDEVVYEAPNSHSRASVGSSSHSPLNLSTTTSLPSLSLEPTPTVDLIRRIAKAQVLSGLKVTPRMRRIANYEKGIRRKGIYKRKKLSLLSLGLQREENILEAETDAIVRGKKVNKTHRRQGSDIDWGTADDSSIEDEIQVQGTNVRKGRELKNKIEPEEETVDSDIDIKDLMRFVRGVEALSKGSGTGDTIDDLEDKMKLAEEDKPMKRSSNTESASSDDEHGGESEEELTSSLSEELSFQTKLKTLRGAKKKAGGDDGDVVQSNGKGKQKAADVSGSDFSNEDEDGNDDLDGAIDKADEDERFLSKIKDILDEDEIWLHGHSNRSGRKSKRDKTKGKGKETFNAVLNGSFEFEDKDSWDISYNTGKKDKVKYLPPGLMERWELDRVKKAERKRERELQRQLEEAELSQTKLALGLSPSGKNKLSKLEKGLLRKTGQGSAAPVSGDASEKLEIEYVSPTTIRITKISHLETLERFIRTMFLPNLDIVTVILPPKDKAWRKEAHDLSSAFNLKNQSRGKEGERFLTLTRTSRSGLAVKASKIRAVLRNERGGRGLGRDKPDAFRERRSKYKTRDGDEVGAAAPKIDSSNIGFKILEKMGWSEGQRIGIVGGLADPLTAIIKTSKLGLGATR